MIRFRRSEQFLVAMFCTMRANVSPTRVLTVEASVANLALTAPLQGTFISCSKLDNFIEIIYDNECV